MTQGNSPLLVNGWSLFAHPLFFDQIEALTSKVEALKARVPRTYKQKNSTKRLAAICKLALEIIPEDPGRSEYRQGGTLGDKRKHWFRARFYRQYRLFFRFHATEKIIVHAWVNDEDSKRACESGGDACHVFRRMLNAGHPPEDWDKLLKEARSSSKGMARLKSSV
ncbi:MAG: type II toxin-antitoxin system YhaV family toxin [Betaproteobacteria bacterium]|nr:type II toxin-antitoxin system YhaV family toxin [Betaproteobacteria bacterium]